MDRENSEALGRVLCDLLSNLGAEQGWTWDHYSDLAHDRFCTIAETIAREAAEECAKILDDAGHNHDSIYAEFRSEHHRVSAHEMREIAGRLRARFARSPNANAMAGICARCGRGPGIATTPDGLCKHCFLDTAPAKAR